MGTVTSMGGEGLHLGEGRADVGLEDGTDLAKVPVSEDEAGVAVSAHLKIGAGGVGVLLVLAADALGHHGFLVH